MLWATWTNTPLVSSLVLCSILTLLWAVDPQVVQLNILVVLAFVALVFSVAPERTATVVEALPGIATTLINDYHLGGLVFTNASMLFTGAATVWLLRRAFQTLWKPVPELIDILGVDVPSPPDVSLTAIGVDKATITWTRPPSNRAVDKYVIQVNGVNVGESATSHDTFITVSGLKPNHFYNVRIIAVGSNNFQAGSRVLRLRTFGSDGRPCLGASRLPSAFTDDDAASASRQQDTAAGSDENGSAKQFVTSTFGVAQPLPSDVPQALSREGSALGGLAPSSRRNTVNRRHSPSTTSLDQQQQLQLFNGTASAPGADEDAGASEAQMAELNQRYLNLRKETEEAAALCAKEEDDMKRLLDELEAEKQAKRKEQKRKEEQTEKLKREQGATDRAMRAAISRRAQKEKRLKEKLAELDRLHGDIEKWDKRITEMRDEQLSYNKQRTELDEQYQQKANDLRQSIKDAQAESLRLEVELKQKRQLVKALEDERTTLASNGDDPGLRAEITALKRQLQRMEADQRSFLNHENRRKEGLDAHILVLSAQIQQIPQSNSYGAYNPSASPPILSNMVSPHAVPPQTTAFDYDPSHNHAKRRSHASNSLSSVAVSPPLPAFSHIDLSGLNPASTPSFVSVVRPPTQSGFLTGPFMGSSADHPGPEDAGFRALTAGAPLSPSATSLLPSNIFADDEPPSPSLNARASSPFVPMSSELPDVLGSLSSFANSSSNKATDSSSSHGSQDNAATNSSSYSTNANVNIDINLASAPSATPEPPAVPASTSGPQSPASSHRSRSILSSPRESSQNLPFSTYGMESVDGRPPPTSTVPSPTGDPAALPVPGQSHNSTRFNLFSFQRSRGPKAHDEEDGPALGTLKHGQSQSFPRQGDEADGIKNRRISLSSMFNRNSVGPELVEGPFAHPGRGVFSARNLFPFGSRTGTIFADRDPSSPRPASMASIDMPRPSTDSSSIWGPPGDTNASTSGLAKASRLWPQDTAWPSRNPSRRPSIHGSPSVLTTNLASADDEILDEEELLNPETSPSQVGVIGSRPLAAARANKTLNPAAPTFMASIFRPKADKDKDAKDKDKDKDKDKGKGKGKDRGKDKSKGREKDKAKASERDQTPGPETPAASAASSGPANLTVEDSPSASRMSRDGLSVHTHASVSESRDSLDYVVSNTTSEPNSLGMLSSSKDSSENALLKLFRKESTSKLSFPRRMGRAKGPGSMASSDKNMSAEHRSSFGDIEDVADEPALSASSSRRTGMSMGTPLATANSSAAGGADSAAGSAGSPLLGPSKPRDKSEGKLKGTGWFSIKKKSREKESLDIDRDRERGLGEPDSTASSLATAASAAADDSDRKAA